MYPNDLTMIPNNPLSQPESEDIYIKQAQLGQRAKEVIENEAFKTSFDELRAYLLVQWQNTDITDSERREALWHQMKCADLFYDNIVVMLQTGKVAQLNLDALKRAGKVSQHLK